MQWDQEDRERAKAEFLVMQEEVSGRPSLIPERVKLQHKAGVLTKVLISSTLRATKGRPEGRQIVASDGS